MKSVKRQALELIGKLPEDCTIEQIRHQVALIDAVTAGLKAVEEGRVMSHEEAMRRAKEWLAPYRQAEQRTSTE